MAQYASLVVHILFLFITFSIFEFGYATGNVNEGSLFHIGAVLDTNSSFGSMFDLCMRMAVSDYYLANPNHTTRLKIHVKNAVTLLDVNLAILDFLNHDDVLGILGPHDETENKFITELGEKFIVPIISFTVRSSIFSQARNGFFVRATPDDALQANALAAICKGFEWPNVVVLYEDTDYGNQFHTHLGKAFEEVEIGLDHINPIPTTVEDVYLLKELVKLSKRQTKVFLVHMSPSLGNRLFTLAKSIGIMSEGYAWIMSDSISNFMDSMDQDTRNSMEGVLGVRPYMYNSKEIRSFHQRWKRNMFLEKDKDSMMELNIYGVWAYDAITALAIAMEKIGPVNSTSSDVTTSKSKRDVKNLRASVGPRLLDELSRTKFRGLTGDFQLVDGKLKQSAFEIFNVYGSGEKTLGFWTPDEGIVRQLSSTGQRNYSTSIKELKNVMWPGDSITLPKGWAIPTTGNLRVGVPRKHGFTEFVNATIDPETNHTYANGFAIDIFLAALKALPFPVNYELHLYSDARNRYTNYDDMLHNIPQNFDMVVADTTIRATRATYVEFSLPYAESGITLVVKNKKPFDMWIFTKPLRWDLWLAIFVACILMGIVLRIMEKQVTRNNEDQINQAPELENRVRNNEAPINQDTEVENRATRNNYHRDPGHCRRFGMIHWSPITILAFPESNMVSNNWSFLVLVFWMFMGFILMQSYTASLSAILTLDQLEFAFSDKYYVGYLGGSFMKHFLTEKLHISASRLRSYASAEGYHEAMSLGSKNGGIDAIFDEIPYMKIFLNKYESQYKMVGPTYKTSGFGFAFPVGSPLVAHFSRAILNVTQGPEITAIEQQNFGPGYSSQDPLSSVISQGPSSLTLYEFAGLFLVVGLVTLFALFCSSTRIGRKLTTIVKHLFHNIRCSVNIVDEQRFARPNEEINTCSTNIPPPRQAVDATVIVPDDSQLDMVNIHEISDGTTGSQDSGDRIAHRSGESSSSEQAEDLTSLSN